MDMFSHERRFFFLNLILLEMSVNKNGLNLKLYKKISQVYNKQMLLLKRTSKIFFS